MRLSRKRAIELCIEAWMILAATGCTKSELPKKHKEIDCGCWFCEYGGQQEKRYRSTTKTSCDYCPLVTSGIAPKDSGCFSTYFSQWDNAKTPRTRKKYAKLFLGQIKSIEQGTNK